MGEKDKVLEDVASKGVKYVELQFTDIVGTLKSVTIPAGSLEDCIERGTWFDGSSIEGFTRIHESDMYLVPDLSTYSIIPWSTDNNSARFICDVFDPEGKPFSGDPRHVLKQMVEKARKKGFEYNTGVEVEFYLFKTDGEMSTLPHDVAGYFDYSPRDMASDIRREVSSNLEKFGIKIEMDHHEVGEGQHEVNFEYGPALRTADNAITQKQIVKAIAHGRGLAASFMPKPIFGAPGSGMHTNQSLFNKEGDNIFFDAEDNYKLSDTARHFVGGQLAHIKAISAVVNPTVNSYKRLGEHEAPTHICWAQKNRSAMIRIPRYSPGKEKATRVELRSPDPSCNPYLAFAVMLAAGLDGIEKKTEPPEPIEANVYTLDEAKLDELKVDKLPPSLEYALDIFENNEIMRDAFGPHLFEQYLAAKRSEWREYQRQVTPWELKKYMKVL